MKSVFYERAADEKNHMYYMNFPTMKGRYKFFGTHVHNSIEMVVCYRGEMSYSINDKHGVFVAGQILLTNSFDTHFYEHKYDAGIYIFVFDRSLLDEVLAKENKEFKNILSLKEEDFNTLLSFVNEEYLKLDTYNLLERKGFVLSLFGKLSKYSEIFQDKSIDSHKNVAREIMEYIDNHYTEDINLETVATFFGYNKNYFSSYFKNVIGMSFITYLNTYRMDKVDLLKKDRKYKNKNREELIKMCGFSTIEKYYRIRKANKNRE